MSSIDTRPQLVDIDHYAGDTLTLHVKIDAALVAGREWAAQVRVRRTNLQPDASFSVETTVDGADITLSTADCQRLARRGRFTGFWDVQLYVPGREDPVTTLAQGSLRIHTDVTRELE
jgi:hypothetical protein